MTDLYEPKGPFRAAGDAIQDANKTTLCVMEEELFIGEAPQTPTHHFDGERLAARIAAALNAEEGSCDACDGSGLVEEMEPECCGDLRHGECQGECAVPKPVQRECSDCNGSGRVPAKPAPAEERVKELEAFRALIADMTLEGEEDDYRGGPFKPDNADQHDTLEYLIRQARNLTGGTTND